MRVAMTIVLLVVLQVSVSVWFKPYPPGCLAVSVLQ
jgi:hypothetical protein